MNTKLNRSIRSVSFFIIVAFYLFAGVNHFINPEFYYPLVPSYLPWPKTINWISGIAEISLAIGLIFKPTRKLSSYLIIVMLLAFLPSHIYFIALGGCVHEGLCVDVWVMWVRLLVVHPILILWVWWHRK